MRLEAKRVCWGAVFVVGIVVESMEEVLDWQNGGEVVKDGFTISKAREGWFVVVEEGTEGDEVVGGVRMCNEGTLLEK
ncbi:hypothetical protein CEUSTIGMA_g11235.t1 [Chlamydomonas eustigma]|uniref:Uncharacterized protein n=1 Tax=Chlamydomonas eustigma TaxID=1157962 RepID=A0A250XLZ9_9CHLO|nr:hypothetical protein CEUSTIGMA_g11235.t1 [Chlamydomonas eustigma]|eukprot:GAX83810.1 hypothetical protein CEUSTIGMA_g11235.t1 [Chlamydomonas eustigma]